MLPRFDVLQPSTLGEACDLLLRFDSEGVAVLAGGTDLLVDIRVPIIPEHLPRCKGCDLETGKPQRAVENPPAYVIALSQIPELRGIEETPDGDIIVGAMTTIADLCKSTLIREKLRALAEGGDHLGSPLVRNRGTIGGNICNARPAADTLVPSYALNAELELVSSQGSRRVKVADFVIGPGRTDRRRGEILTKIIFAPPGPNSGSSFRKLANRKALEISVVNAASMVVLGDDGNITDARIALGAVAPTPILAKKAAQSLVGMKPSTDLFVQAGEIAASECHPISDHRGSKPYRVDMVKILVRRTLERAVPEIL
jgi:carbon-monoxide dehydrogenase medium subunit